MVANPAPVPLKPLTVATASPGYKSDGRTLAMVLNEA